LKITWDQKENYIKNLKKIPAPSFSIVLKILAYLVCLMYLGYNTSGHFFTVELKVTKGNKVKFSPHQIAFHKSHPKNTFILLKALGPSALKLVPGSKIQELLDNGHGPWPVTNWIEIQKLFELAA
tara:strand:+ start:850 stop:1224 length:375 start_codon:yes stop_codon:yes gene_type:complete